LEIHYTPKHGSWLNMAETELSVLSRQCLDRRIGTQPCLESEVLAWTQARNTSATTVDWQFTTDDARIKLKRLYPVITTLEEGDPPALDASAALLPAEGEVKRKTKPRRCASRSKQTAAQTWCRNVSRPVVHNPTT
jgi:hypothetical protein